MPLSSQARFRMSAAVALGLSAVFILSIAASDIQNQIDNAPRVLPVLSNGNPAGYGTWRDFRDYGAPHYGGLGSMINPPLSDAEFKSHFLFGRDKIAEVLACLQFPKTAGRPANRDFAIRCDRHGNPIRWVGAETALLVFLKRLRTRGDAVIQLQSFFGRSEGWISLVFNAVVTFIAAVWVPIKIQRLDERVFNRFRLQDYAKCLWRNGLYIPHVVGFVDGTFHSICRPGGDGYNGTLQQAFYNASKKGHGLQFELITFPDGIIGRAFGPLAGRHHDLYVARKSGLRDLLRTGALKGFRLFGDKAYLGFRTWVLHPFVNALPGSLKAKWNTYTSSYRIEVEHDIGMLYMHAGCLTSDMRLETQVPEDWFQAAVLIVNIHTCVYHGNQTSIRFHCAPPSLVGGGGYMVK